MAKQIPQLLIKIILDVVIVPVILPNADIVAVLILRGPIWSTDSFLKLNPNFGVLDADESATSRLCRVNLTD